MRFLKTTKYKEISVLFLRHTRSLKDGHDKESILVTISTRHNSQDNWDREASFRLELSLNSLYNITHSEKAMKYRNQSLLNIANELMPVLA